MCKKSKTNQTIEHVNRLLAQPVILLIAVWIITR